MYQKIIILSSLPKAKKKYSNWIMEKYHIEATKITPHVLIDYDQRVFELKGKSSPENSNLFYSEIISALDSYKVCGQKALKVVIDLEYFNTSSSKKLFDLFKILDELNEIGVKVEVDWYYLEWDDEMLESAEDFSEMLNIDFNIFSKEEEYDDED